MSVRRTVAQSSAGLLLLAAFAAGPTAVYAEPGDPSDSGSGEPQCTQDANGQYETTLSVAPSQVAPGQTVSLTVRCFPGPDRQAATVDVTGKNGQLGELDPISRAPGSTDTLTFTVPENAAEGDYLFVVNIGTFNNNAPFTVVGDGAGDEGDGDNGSGGDDGSDGNEGGGDDGSDDSGSGSGDGEDGADQGDDTTDPSEGGDGSGSDDTGQEQGGDDQNLGDTEGADGTGSDNGDDAGAGDSGSDDEQQDTGNGNAADDTEDSEEEQQGGDTTASGSPTKPFPGGEKGDNTSASSANDNASSTGNAPAQPPAAPGSATNDFPAAQQEATADQKQSAALAVLMTKLFAGGVSSGSVGTTPDQARTVIDPSAAPSEIEVPAGSDTGGSSDNGSDSETSDGNALAATGSNMLIPAGIAAAAILLGAGLKIHQIRRGL